MKFMKLGSRPDTFYSAEAVRSVSSEVSSDFIIQVKGTRYLLHKFPLLSKCLRLQKLCSESLESPQNLHIVQLPDFPGGVEAFELCAKFCYGITITLSAYNIVSARCAAEYLQMTEDVEKGNLIHKIEVFFNSCILYGWKDTIVTLQSTKAFPLWSEDLGITARCIESIASRVSARPTKVSLSHTSSRRRGGRDDIVEDNRSTTSKEWWAEDLAQLGIDLYWRTVIAIKSNGKVQPALIGEALRIYASRWLPNISKYVEESDYKKHRLLLESIISLLPGEKGEVSCSFLLKLLKAANILQASPSSKMELARRVGLQLEEASVSDLLIPCLSSQGETVYDVDVVMSILEEFLMQGQSPPTSPVRVKRGGDFEKRRRSRSAENLNLMLQDRRRSSSASHSAKLKVAKLVDGYLQKIAMDKNLPLSKFIAIAEAVPEFARVDHDDLYKAIDIYLKEHLELSKSERKRLCRILDCKKLSMEACMHAARNEMLPLRVVVQVLFFEQARATMAGGGRVATDELPSNIKALLAAKSITTTTSTYPPGDQWSVSGLKSSPKSSNLSTLKMKLDEDDNDFNENFEEGVVEKSSKVKIFGNRHKRMLSKLWPINRSAAASEKN